VPPPHFFVHLDHLAHFFIMQFRGHPFVLQAATDLRVGHFLPPYLGETRMRLVRLFLPPPHFLLQRPQRCHFETLQLMRQFLFELHLRF